MDLSLEQHMIAFSHCKSPLGLKKKLKLSLRNTVALFFFLSNDNFNKVTLLFEH